MGEASVEHLVASSKGGGNGDDNCVACCQSLNTLLGNMPLKEKLRILLNQKGKFKCPGPNAPKTRSSAKTVSVVPSVQKTFLLTDAPLEAPTANPIDDKLVPVIAFLIKQGRHRPIKLAGLRNSLGASFPTQLSAKERVAVVEQLQARGYIIVENGNISYELHPKRPV